MRGRGGEPAWPPRVKHIGEMSAWPELAGERDRALVELLEARGQAHVFADWPPAGEATDEKRRLLARLRTLDSNYPGGIGAYIDTARRLLAEAQRGDAWSGWAPSLPSDGAALDPSPSGLFAEHEERGLALASTLGFVVPAGGLGERLGWSGVKFDLPAELASEMKVLEVYAGYILAAQAIARVDAADARGVAGEVAGSGDEGAPSGGRAGRVELPLAIMVSDDTEAQIRDLLEENFHFGLEPRQVTILKQEKVAALADSDASFALSARSGRRELLTKPHGHGDVHFLMHSSGTARRWHESGVRHLYFFQARAGRSDSPAGPHTAPPTT